MATFSVETRAPALLALTNCMLARPLRGRLSRVWTQNVGGEAAVDALTSSLQKRRLLSCICMVTLITTHPPVTEWEGHPVTGRAGALP